MSIDVNSLSQTTASIASMDLATALMMVQSQRTELLESQLKDQLTTVSLRNEQIAKLNDVLSAITTIQNHFGTTDATMTYQDATKTTESDKIMATNLANLTQALKDAGIDASFTVDSKLGDFNSEVTKVKGMIDAQSNTQQMDMLRIQSLSGKRNESFDLMTNSIKKFQDGNSAILSNYR